MDTKKKIVTLNKRALGIIENKEPKILRTMPNDSILEGSFELPEVS